MSSLKCERSEIQDQMAALRDDRKHLQDERLSFNDEIKQARDTVDRHKEALKKEQVKQNNLLINLYSTPYQLVQFVSGK